MIAPVKIFNADDPRDRQILRNQSFIPGFREAKPRDFSVRPYGSVAEVPAIHEAAPDVLLDPKDYKEAIRVAHEAQQFPSYYQNDAWAPDGTFKSNQGRLNYCWAWSIVAGCMDLRAIHLLDTVMLAPVSLGKTVGWRNDGNYLLDGIQFTQNEGICRAPDGDFNNPNRSRDYWLPHEGDRVNFRLDRVWDIDTRSGDAKTIQQCVSCLYFTCPIYIAYNWWGHALELVAVIWDESKPNNLIWVIRNSHGELTFIFLEGSKAVPDECYALVSMVVSAIG